MYAFGLFYFLLLEGLSSLEVEQLYEEGMNGKEVFLLYKWSLHITFFLLQAIMSLLIIQGNGADEHSF
ncbi:hypothetical protein [Psychrobacillus sp. NPDC093180]|uniref:hypothetical protein n=1 Tax=Psychrobacillus sp. NPDC093180 TaxID=3364489 RepID=UPI003816992F